MYISPHLSHLSTLGNESRDLFLLRTNLVRHGFKKWNSHQLGSHSGLQTPQSACQIHRPLRLIAWKKAFSHCPTFIDSWKGLNLRLSETCIRHREFIDQQWFYWQWHHSGFNVSIMTKELVPITSSCTVWGPRFAKTRY